MFLKYRLNSYEFYKPVIKSKNMNKTKFLKFLYLKMLNHALHLFIYAYMY